MSEIEELRAQLAAMTAERDDMMISWTGPEATKALLRERDEARAALAKTEAECERLCNSYAEENQRLSDAADQARAALAKAVADEREACAKLASTNETRSCDCDVCYCGNIGDAIEVAFWDACEAIATAIRARGPAND